MKPLLLIVILAFQISNCFGQQTKSAFKGDWVVLTAPADIKGSSVWEVSNNQTGWTEISNSNNSPEYYYAIPYTTTDSAIYFRLKLTNEPNCPAFYSFSNKMRIKTALVPTIPTIKQGAIGATTVKFTGSVHSNQGSLLIEKGICWSSLQNPLISDNKISKGIDTGFFAITIVGLKPGSNYHARTYAQNDLGLSYSQNQSFTTSDTLSIVLVDSIYNVSYTTALVAANITDNGGSAITARGICWSTSQNPTIANAKTSKAYVSNVFSDTITGLTANTIYYVRAYSTNKAGTSYGQQLSFTTKALSVPILTTTEISNISQTSATTGGTIKSDGGASITAKGVCWSTTENPTITNSKTINGTGNIVYASSLTGLAANTTYYVRAYATNSVGTGYASQISFKTSPGTPTISTTSVSSITDSSVISGGNVTSDGGATVTARGICWSTSSSPTITNNKTADSSGVGSFASKIKGLTFNTTYYIRAYATNSFGTSYGTEISFKTSPKLPVITTNTISSITQTTATGGGNITSDGGATVTARGVCWSTSNNPTTANSKTTNGTATGSYTSSITGLSPGTSYYVRAYATNSVGTVYSTQISFKTSPSTPTISTSSVSSITDSSAISGGNVTSDGGEAITARGICWSTTVNPTISNNKTSESTGLGSFPSAIKGLTFNTTYYIRAYATNSLGTSYGSEVSFKTSQKLPVITSNSVSSITQTTATGGGNITSDGGATVTARGVCWSTSNNPTIANSKTSNSTGTGSFVSSITGLTTGITYYVRAYATNSVGTAYGNEVSFTTLAKASLTTTTASSITSSTASSGGDITSNGGANVTARGVCWSTTSNPTTANSKTSNGTGSGSFTSSITGLLASTTYYVKAYATNSVGTNYGNETSFTTYTTLPSISTLSITSINQTSAICGGNIIYNGGTAITASGICWSKNINPTISDSKTTDGTSSGSFASSLIGLILDSTYYVRAYATNNVGTGYGNQLSFKTLLVDVDGNVYQKVTIGSQVWMVENLKTTKYNDGTAIPKVTDNTAWSNLTTPAYCWAENDSVNNKPKYGALYNWHTINTGKLCPIGWHIPDNSEWDILINYLGGFNDAGITLQSNVNWPDPAFGSNYSGFTALPGGARNYLGSFFSRMYEGYWWSSDSYNNLESFYIRLQHHNISVYQGKENNNSGLSVRCIKSTLPVIQIDSVFNKTESSASCAIKVVSDGGDSITARGVCWSTLSNPTISNSKSTNGTGIGNFTCSIASLSHGTTYYVRAYATNAVGTSYGNETSFTTNTTVKDYDGNVYNIITIGSQVWMAENLKTTKYTDGTAIPFVNTTATWDTLTVTSKAYCWYNDDIANKATYGALYTWAAAMNGAASNTNNPSGVQGVCPNSWHLPSDSEWTTLITNLGGESVAGDKLKETGTSHWNSPNTGATNETNFTALPGGYRNFNGSFTNIGVTGSWWCTTENLATDAWHRYLYFGSSYVTRDFNLKEVGYSVRCIKDNYPSLANLTTTTISAITAFSASSGGNISSDGGATVTARGVCWSTTSNPTTANSKTTDGSGAGSFSSSITGLSAGTTYYVRAYATNSVGTAYDIEVSFTTPTLASLTSTSASSVTSTTASSGGDITSDGGATATARGVCWSTTSNPTTANSKTTDGSGAGSFSSSITGLSAGTTYYVRAYATNSVGTAYGNEVSFTTNAVLPTISTVSITSINQTSAISGGVIINNGGTAITASGICWSKSINPTITDSKTTDGTSSGTFSSSLTGLLLDSTYYVRAYATNSIGTSYGNLLSFTTFLVDIDGNIYQKVTIGTQVWMKENLKTTKYNDGSNIPNITDASAWLGLSTGAYCWFNNDGINYKNTYGGLYNWNAVISNKLCPVGWHIPTNSDWSTLISFLGGESLAGGKLKEIGISHWLSPNSIVSNSYGFNALPGGDRNLLGEFVSLGYHAIFWSANTYSTENAWIRQIYHYSTSIYDYNYSKKSGYSVRCIKD